MTVLVPLAGLTPDALVQRLVLLCVFIVLTGGAWLLMRLGRIHSAAAALLAVLYLGTVLSLLVTQTLHDPAIVGFFGLVIAGALLYGRRIALGIGALTALTVVGLHALEGSGGFGASAPVQARPHDLLLTLVGVAMSAALAVAYREMQARASRLFQAVTQLEQQRAQDVMAQDEANRQLADARRNQLQSEARLRQLVENSHDHHAIWDRAARAWLYVSHPQWLGQPTPELLTPSSMLEYVHPDDHSRVRANWLTATQPSELEIRLRNSDGAWEWVHARTRAFSTDASGDATQVLVSLSLVTERKNEERLRLALEQAEAATRAKSEFLANMSHEIRTPINGIIGMTNLLQATDLTDDQRVYLNTIRNSSSALLTIMDDILDLSKAESGRLAIEHWPLDVRRAVEEVLDLLAPKASEKNLELFHTIAPTVPSMVLGDATRLRQVLIKLVSNAITFTPRGEVSIAVAARAIDARHVELHFAVRDTGIGIARDQIPHLFQAFNQADGSNTRDDGGAGLGLVMSKKLCELMGGSIWVESDLQIGSVFHFTIATPIVEGAAGSAITTVHQALKGRRALIVDDNHSVRQILQDILSNWGMSATATASGTEALEATRQRSGFDIAIIDMQMPEMPGLTLAKELRKRFTDLPIVLTSALGAPMYAAEYSRQLHDLPIVISPTPGIGDAHEAVRHLGVKHVILKPLKPTVLQAALLDHLDVPVKDKTTTSPPAHKRVATILDPAHPIRMLVAEDNVTNQKVALHMLKRLGYTADVAANGLEALNAVLAQYYDVILMDIQMPEMDGLEATRRIRSELPESEQPYIIAITAAAMQVDRAQCLAAGMDDFLAKPTRLEDLAKALHQFLPVPIDARTQTPPRKS